MRAEWWRSQKQIHNFDDEQRPARRRMSSNETNTCVRRASLWTNVKASWHLGGPILAERKRLGTHPEEWRLHLLACLSRAASLSMGCWAGVPRPLRPSIPTAEPSWDLGIFPHTRFAHRASLEGSSMPLSSLVRPRACYQAVRFVQRIELPKFSQRSWSSLRTAHLV